MPLNKKGPAGATNTSEAVPANRVVNKDPEHLYCTTQPGKNQVPGIFMPKNGGTIMRYAMYLRKSRADDASEPIEVTLQRHRQALENYMVQHDLTVLPCLLYTSRCV